VEASGLTFRKENGKKKSKGNMKNIEKNIEKNKKKKRDGSHSFITYLKVNCDVAINFIG
jgi:hypothetical protein